MFHRVVFLVLLVLGCVATVDAAYPTMTVATVRQLQGYIEGAINNTARTNPDGTVRLPMIAAFVRLAFHDCNSPAGCDGCVNLAIAENNGLKPPVDLLESLYRDPSLVISTKLSRADFWALAGLSAANYGARLQRPPPRGGAVYIPPALVPANVFKSGRKDCPTAPVGTEASSNFPNGLKGQTETFAFFKNFYNFTAAEAVAILGAHTLGRAVVQDSGFQGPWVPGDNILNNQYYVTLSSATAGWAQVKVPGPGGLIQWQRQLPGPAPQPTFLMLNADMCTYKSLTLNSTGGSSCTYSTCPNNPLSYQSVLTYAANNTKWLDDFAVVFNKMLNTCGHPSAGVVTACVLTAPKAASIASSATLDMDILTTSAEAAAAGGPDVPVVPMSVALTGDPAVAGSAVGVQSLAFDIAQQADGGLVPAAAPLTAPSQGAGGVDASGLTAAAPLAVGQDAAAASSSVQPATVVSTPINAAVDAGPVAGIAPLGPSGLGRKRAARKLV